MSDKKTIEAAIKANRTESNDAIKAHDDFKVSALFDRDAIVVTGGGQPIATRKALRATFVQQFRQSPDLVYTRTPKTIDVSDDLTEAAEAGTWEGSWSMGEQKVTASGSYMALWHPVADKWQIKAEMFATLHEAVK